MGGHGGLNILPQKRWNVYNYDNREKVEKDQELLERARQQREKNKISSSLGQRINKIKREQKKANSGKNSNQEEEKEEIKESKNKKVKLYAEENKLFESLKSEERKKNKKQESEIKNELFKEVASNQHINLFKQEEMNEKLKASDKVEEVFIKPQSQFVKQLQTNNFDLIIGNSMFG
jgi:hypothetical protein